MRKIIYSIMLLFTAASSLAQTNDPATVLSADVAALISPTRAQYMAEQGRKWVTKGYQVQRPKFGADSVRVVVRATQNGTKANLYVCRMVDGQWKFVAVPKKKHRLYVPPDWSSCPLPTGPIYQSK
jgi:hypothetical protein